MQDITLVRRPNTLSRMQLAVHATCRTNHGASRLVNASLVRRKYGVLLPGFVGMRGLWSIRLRHARSMSTSPVISLPCSRAHSPGLPGYHEAHRPGRCSQTPRIELTRSTLQICFRNLLARFFPLVQRRWWWDLLQFRVLKAIEQLQLSRIPWLCVHL